MPNAWITALKQWNAQRPGVYCVPRKGTKEYDEVRAIMSAPAPTRRPPVPDEPLPPVPSRGPSSIVDILKEGERVFNESLLRGDGRDRERKEALKRWERERKVDDQEETIESMTTLDADEDSYYPLPLGVRLSMRWLVDNFGDVPGFYRSMPQEFVNDYKEMAQNAHRDNEDITTELQAVGKVIASNDREIDSFFQ